MPREFSTTEILDEASELFQDRLFKGEHLDLYLRGFITLTDLCNRIEDISKWARRMAEETLKAKSSKSA